MRSVRFLCFFGGLVALNVPFPASADEPIQLTQSPAIDRNPTWSADGSFIVFQSNRTGDWHLFRVPVTGGTVEQITFSNSDELYPEISPDGMSIVYVQGNADSNGGLGYSAIQIIPVDGGTPVTVVPGTGAVRVHPTWSPDGSTIYYTRSGLGGTDIYEVPAAGGSESFVLHLADDYSQAISPDGTRIAFASRPAGQPYNLHESPLTAPNQAVQLTSESANTSQPDYSPDGTRIALASRKILGRMELFELELSTGILTRLTFDAEASPFDPASQFPEYSRDGGHIAFSSRRVAGDENIWILPISGSPPAENVLGAGSGRGLPGPGTVTVPVSLQSSQSSPALEFRLADTPDWLEVIQVRTVGRASSLSASFVDEGDAHVLVYSQTKSPIPPGTGTILELEVRVKPGAVEGDSLELHLADLVFSDVNGQPLIISAIDGVFEVGRLDGDINADNLVDVGDLVRLVEIILETGDPATPEELVAADCNQDTHHNALDVPCLLDLILEGAGTAALAAATDGALQGLVLSVREDVRGIQFAYSGSSPASVPADAVAPFVFRTGDSNGNLIALAFDPAGNGWAAGSTIPLPAGTSVGDFRAYGPGGRRLLVEATAQGIRIGTPVPHGLFVGAPSRNPFSESTDIRFSIDRTANVTVAIYDLRGAQVAVLPSRIVEAGRHSWPWDARDDWGRRVPPGVYFALVEGGGLRGAVRLIHLAR